MVKSSHYTLQNSQPCKIIKVHQLSLKGKSLIPLHLGWNLKSCLESSHFQCSDKLFLEKHKDKRGYEVTLIRRLAEHIRMFITWSAQTLNNLCYCSVNLPTKISMHE